VSAVEYMFGQVNRLPVTIEWLSDNGSCYVAGDTAAFARDIGLTDSDIPSPRPPGSSIKDCSQIKPDVT
jgi:putative transposase